jgi:dimethylamine/trimethylamine dehydrogenase
MQAQSVVMVTSRSPVNDLYASLASDPERLGTVGIKSVKAIGDCDAPATIAAAVYDGHQAARILDSSDENPDLPFRRESIALSMSV